MEKTLALFDSDAIYATRFMEYFSKEEIPEFDIITFTSPDNITQYMASHIIDVLLIGDNINLEGVPIEQIRHLYQLTDTHQSDSNNIYPTILKYQSAKAILKRVLSDQSVENERSVIHNASQTAILTIVTPIPHLETLSFSWALTTLMSEQSNLLFTLFDLFPIPYLTPNNNNQKLSDLIYYLKENSNLSVKLQALVQTLHLAGMNKAVDYLSGIYHSSDLLSLNKEDINNLVGALRTGMNYTTVVFYVNFATEAMMELMKLSDSVMVVSFDSAYERALLNEWNAQMERIGLSVHSDQYHFVTLNHEEGSIPTTLQELKQSMAWESATQCLNIYEIGR